MNDIAKKSISEKFTKAVQTEKLQVKDAAMAIGIMPTYASMIRNEALWKNCPIPVWDKALAWVNSGQSLKVYGEKHGHVLPGAPAPGVKTLTPEEKDALGHPFKEDDKASGGWWPGWTPKEKEVMGESIAPTKKASIPDDPETTKAIEDFIQLPDPEPEVRQYTESARLKVCLDIEINLVINGQKVQVK